MKKQNTSFPKFARQYKAAQQGVVLLEAMIAILLFSMGVLAVVGLQAAMIKNTSDSKFRSEASYIAQQWIGMMWSNPDPAMLATYLIASNDPQGRDNISTLLPNGTRIVSQPNCVAPFDIAECPFVITITWQQPGQDQHFYTTTASISGG